MRANLKEVLDVHPGARRVMRHLVYFERALAAEGLRALSTNEDAPHRSDRQLVNSDRFQPRHEGDNDTRVESC